MLVACVELGMCVDYVLVCRVMGLGECVWK